MTIDKQAAVIIKNRLFDKCRTRRGHMIVENKWLIESVVGTVCVATEILLSIINEKE